ncbi:MAG: DsbA family protein [Acidimicrobiia bacterium]|nr:DsbA family protein [Acidimicrobiia bacterium]
MPAEFAITFDYLCPFARNLNESVLEALAGGAEWKVHFRPFSLAQTKVVERELDVWDRDRGATGTRGVLALQWGIAVRDRWPAGFSDFHLAAFAARHEQGADIGDEAVLATVAGSVGLDAAAVAGEVDSGRPLESLAAEHLDLVAGWDVFGVPTLISGEEAVFVRLMERHRPEVVQRLLDLVGWRDLNEFKRTRIPR